MDHSVGIIGGADGPTAVFVTGFPFPVGATVAVVAIVLIVGIVLFLKNKDH